MQKQEFEERIERTVTDEQYKVIEEVYMWHPSIRNTSGKDEVAELYKSFGMTIFHDMLPRAKKAHELDELLMDDLDDLLTGHQTLEDLRSDSPLGDGFHKIPHDLEVDIRFEKCEFDLPHSLTHIRFCQLAFAAEFLERICQFIG